jgi:hypothetical protein
MKDPVGGGPRVKRQDRPAIRSENLQALYEILHGCWKTNAGALAVRGFTLPQSDSFDSVTLGNLPWTQNTAEALEFLGFDSDSSISVIEGLTWGEIYSGGEGGAAAFFEITQTISDWLPYAFARRLLIEQDATLDSIVECFQRELVARAGFDAISQFIYSNLLARRNGWGREAETLDQIGADLQLTRERVRQIESIILTTANSSNRRSWHMLNEIASFQLENNYRDPYGELDAHFSLGASWSIAALKSLLQLSNGSEAAEAFSESVTVSDVEKSERAKQVKVLRAACSDVGVIKLDTIAIPGSSDCLSIKDAVSLTEATFGSVNVFGNYAVVSRKAVNAGLYTAVANQLWVQSPLHVDQVYTGALRVATQRNAQGTFPDRNSFTNLIRQSEDFVVSEDLLVSGRMQEHEPGTIQRWLVDFLLTQDGYVSSKAEVYRTALAARIKLSSLNLYVTFQSTLRTPESGLLCLVGQVPSRESLDFANRVAEAKYVSNSPLRVSSIDSNQYVVEFIFSTPFMISGTVTSTVLLQQLFGTKSKKVRCCSEFDNDSESVVSISKSFLYGLAPLKDHLLYRHDRSEGDQLHFRFDEDTFRVVL